MVKIEMKLLVSCHYYEIVVISTFNTILMGFLILLNPWCVKKNSTFAKQNQAVDQRLASRGVGRPGT